MKSNKDANTTQTRNVIDFQKDVNNVYEAIAIMSKRANQINTDLKEEINQRLQEFNAYSDNLEEIFENREQIEMSRQYEKMPKPVLLAQQEFLEDKVYFKNPTRDNQEID
jgi:DNA-directed RNA polymerase subunit K/omega